MKSFSLLSLYFLVFFFWLAPGPCFGQEKTDTSSIWRIETLDGNEYLGQILSRNENEIILETESLGVLTIQVRNVRRIQEVRPEQMKAGELWPENPQSTRYFWAPNGYGLKKGEGYYQNVWVLFNQVSYGFTDNFSMGLGILPTFFFGGAPTPVWITPKFSVPVSKDRFNLGAGALIGTVLGEGNSSFGIAYGVATLGSRDQNLNVGLGYGFAGGEWANVPTISLGGMVRVGRRGYLLTENYLIDTGDTNLVLITLGGRSVWNKLSLDYGLVIPAASDIEFVAIPWLGLVLPFGQ